MKNERVLITGCGGMLGNAIYPYFVSRYMHVLATDKEVTDKWLMPLDVRDEFHLSMVFADFKPDLVLHLAAETNLEYCEIHEDIAKETNQHATATVAKLAEQYGATMVYISTAGVFDGKKTEPYTEEDAPNPIMIYGRTKYEGEQLTRQHCKRSYVVRAGWMMGGGRYNEKKFIYKILKQLEEGKREIHAVDDRWGTPTYTYDFAQNLFCLLETGWYGTYHMVCEGSGTRYDVASEIVRVCNRNDVSITAVASDFFKDVYFAPRPASEIMCNAALEKRGINCMRNWKISLDDYLKTFFADFITGNNTLKAEQRGEGRKNVHLPLLFQQDGREAEKSLCGAIVTDMSRYGIGIVTEKKLGAGQKILLSPKQLTKQSIPAVIQWTEQIGGRTRAGLSLMDSSPIWEKP